MNKLLNTVLYSVIGFAIGHFAIGGLLSYTGNYSFFVSFLGILISFVIIVNLKSYFYLMAYSIFLSLGSFSGIDYVIPEILSNFLNITKENSWLVSVIIGTFKLYFVYIIILFKYIFIDNENFISTNFEKIQFEYRILIISSFVWGVQILTEYVFPGQIGYILNAHVTHLNLLSLIGISGYSYFLTFLCVFIAFSIKEKRFKQYSFYCFILFFLLVNFAIRLNLDENYSKDEGLQVRVVQYPFYKLKEFNSFPDQFIRDELFPIIKHSENVDLILFPEASIPYVYQTFDDFSKLLLIKEAKKYNKNIQLSLLKKEGEELYNTSILFRYNRVPSFYYKEQLFPIGENDPILTKLFIDKSGIENMSLKENKNRLFKINNINYLPLLCFENYNPNLFRNTKEDIWSFVTIQSNESWIFEEKMRDYLVNFLKIRAREFNTFVVKSDSMGPSGIIDNNGNEIVLIKKDNEYYDYKIPNKKSNKYEYYYQYRELTTLGMILIQMILVLFCQRFLSFKRKYLSLK